MTEKRSIKRSVQKAKTADSRTRKAVAKAAPGKALLSGATLDSFVNFQAQLGVGANNQLSTSGYGFNPVTRVRTLLEWIHRGSWLGGIAIDIIAEDMVRAGVEITHDVDPEGMAKINSAATRLGIWTATKETVQWSRLYGGCLAVMMIEGQNWATPLKLDRVSKGQFQGLLVLDRWMVEPSLNDLIQDPGPTMGLPKYYTITTDAPALPKMKIHHSRCIRLGGIKLPFWQAQMENLWGMSVIERLWDRMVAFDSATTGAAQLVFKAYIRTYKIKGFRGVLANGGKAMEGLLKMCDMMRGNQGIEGMTLIDSEDDFEGHEHGAFTGLAEALLQFAQQLSGALQIPLVRLFGQSPAGLNSTGESDLRTYYDGILQQQNDTLLVPMTQVYECIARSEGVEWPKGAGIKFRNLWQLDEVQKADVAEKTTRTIAQAEEGGLISQQTAMKELKQLSTITGVFTNITDEDIQRAEETLPPAGEEAMQLEQENLDKTLASKGGSGGNESGEKPSAPSKPSD